MFNCNYKIILSKGILLPLLLFFITTKAQIINNLVPNPSFEEYNNCPNNVGQLGQIYDCNLWYRIDYWSTPDYYNSCATTSSLSAPLNWAGNQIPSTGNAYIGFVPYSNGYQYRENIAIKLKEKLKKNKNYCITYYLSLAEVSRICISNIGVIFRNDSIKNFYPIPTPYYANTFEIPVFENPNSNLLKDTINWMKIQGTYISNGTELNIGIGNFQTDVNTNYQFIKPITNNPNKDFAYYYIDDVSLIEINPAKAAAQKTINVCAGATYTLGTDSTEEASYLWQPSIGLSCSTCPNPVLTASTNLKYVLTKQQCSATTKDSVYINIITGTNTAKAGSAYTVCPNATVQLGINDTSAFSTYTWQPTNLVSCVNCPITNATASLNTIFYLNKKECQFFSKDSVTLTMHTPTTTANAGASQTLCLNEQQQLGTNDVNGYSTYTWQPYQNLTCLNCAQPFANAIGNITYTLSRQECSSITQSTVNLTLDDCELLLPQGISPNGDGLNEQLQVIVPNAQSAKLTVFNRWGSELYSVSNTKPATNNKYPLSIELTWDAKAHKGLILGNGIVPSGTYFYIVEVTQNNGTKKVYKEFVQVVY
ncbi:MAG: gliding motility-associated C-terminal domain-containing protein [Bacteroidetes bacterium]|nr:gliding motility-associated C-terminal domain-containing protein [Bacteroidota bacterium]